MVVGQPCSCGFVLGSQRTDPPQAMMSELLLLKALMPVKRISRKQFNQRLPSHQVPERLTGLPAK